MKRSCIAAVAVLAISDVSEFATELGLSYMEMSRLRKTARASVEALETAVPLAPSYGDLAAAENGFLQDALLCLGADTPYFAAFQAIERILHADALAGEVVAEWLQAMIDMSERRTSPLDDQLKLAIGSTVRRFGSRSSDSLARLLVRHTLEPRDAWERNHWYPWGVGVDTTVADVWDDVFPNAAMLLQLREFERSGLALSDLRSSLIAAGFPLALPDRSQLEDLLDYRM